MRAFFIMTKLDKIKLDLQKIAAKQHTNLQLTTVDLGEFLRICSTTKNVKHGCQYRISGDTININLQQTLDRLNKVGLVNYSIIKEQQDLICIDVCLNYDLAMIEVELLKLSL